MFINCNKSMIFCVDKTLLANLQLEDYPNLICSENCFKNENNKIIYDNSTCIDNCKINDTYKFEYDGRCYEDCPNGTHNYLNNNFLCEKDLNFSYIPETENIFINFSYIPETENISINFSYIPETENISINFSYIPETENIFINFSNQISDTNYNSESTEITYISNKILNENIFIFNDTNLKNKTSILINQELIQFILNQFNIREENVKIFFKIEEYPSSDPRRVTNDYNYTFILENGTELDLNEIKEDFEVKFSSPIRNLDAANFNYVKYFSEKGFDIYDKNSDFYNDYCCSASINGNDITLKDRRKEIYPNNISLCKENCYYSSVNVEEERIICSCNLFTNKNYSNNESENDDFLKEDDGNFISYLLDNINYKIFKCYKLLLSFENIKANFSFYTILSVFVAILILDFIFYFHSIKKLKILMYKESPINNKIITETKQFLQNENVKSSLNPTKKCGNKKREENKNSTLNIDNNNSNELKKDSKEKEDLNELPYGSAIKNDKRNIFEIFYSIIILKIELINILFFSQRNFRIILISEYILSLLINFFFNTLLYSDEVISNKYHNNGELDFFVTLVLTILSNIISSIICYYLNYAAKFEDLLELIKEIKIKSYYFMNVFRFLKLLKIKFFILLISQILAICCCFYYIIIFFIVYTTCKKSLIINFITSLVEGLILSFVISLIVAILRKISIKCLNKHIYNTSKYIDKHF